MNEQPEMLSFVKAMASADRLRIIGVLVRGRATPAEIAEQLHVPVRDLFDNLSFLVQVGVLNETNGAYDLNEKAIEVDRLRCAIKRRCDVMPHAVGIQCYRCRHKGGPVIECQHRLVPVSLEAVAVGLFQNGIPVSAPLPDLYPERGRE